MHDHPACGQRSDRRPATALRWLMWPTGWTGLGAAVVLAACSVTGVLAMMRLEDRADQARVQACAAAPTAEQLRSVHWEKGFDAWLPITTATTAAMAALTLISIITTRQAGTPHRVLRTVALGPVLLLTLLSVLLLHDFYAYPGGDMSTVSALPCGAG